MWPRVNPSAPHGWQPDPESRVPFTGLELELENKGRSESWPREIEREEEERCVCDGNGIFVL